MFQIKKQPRFANKYMLLKGLAGLCIALMALVGVIIPVKHSQVQAAGRTNYTQIATFSVWSQVSNFVAYDVTYKVYISNGIYYDAGIALIFDPITYHAGETPGYAFTNTKTTTYSVNQTISSTVANEISSSIGVEAEGLKASIGSKLSASVTSSHSSTLSYSQTFTDSRTSTLPPVDHDGVWGAIYRAARAQYLVVKATVIKNTRKDYILFYSKWTPDATPIFKEKDVFQAMIPAQERANCVTDVDVWDNADAFWDDLNNLYRAPSTEIGAC